ncbi:YceI family protein [Streptacidiphilus jiangxiensis]|uniref:Polyisoprenoid-binding protein YceI n=1 Tax=Streptacidiphilus jiangxiensis TaxID=235985 RepID=A0A1H7NYN5_STRJI|nr:YceI family protein [Streptacidiphilus jiangxiensis]SEL28623.1 Polyisoprenoid-binding protein YceI [Streptacidiphilus jiangxiensis]
MTTATPTPTPGHYAIDVPRSEITFTTKHLFGLGTVRGSFQLRGGNVSLAQPLTATRVDAVADAGSFDTGNKNRDRQVLSKALLDTENYPDIVFSAAGAELDQAGAWALQGRLTAHGVDAPVTFTVTKAEVVGDEIAVEATATVDRYAHGVTKLKGMAARHLQLTASVRARRTDGSQA